MNGNTTRYFNCAISIIILCLINASSHAGGLLAVDFEEAEFSFPLIIDNPYWPLRPDSGPRTFVYVAKTEDECVIDKLSINDNFYGGTYELSTDDVNSPYYGLTVVQVVDTEWVYEDIDEEDCNAELVLDDDAIKELTLDWYVQDDKQNIWYVGEASRDFEPPCPSLAAVPIGGDFGDEELEEECTGGSWEAGITAGDEGEEVTAAAGIIVPSNEPVDGQLLENGTSYMQEFAFDAQDMAKILKLKTSLTVDEGDFAGEYENCRKVKEWNPYEPGASVEHKIYCADGAGLMLTEGVGGGVTERELLFRVVE